MGKGMTVLLGIGLLLGALVLLALLAFLWPGKGIDANGEEFTTTEVKVFGSYPLVVFEISLEVRLILIVAVAGALGSYVHAARSFGDYAGNRQLRKSWLWFYLLRSPIGMGLALVFYFVTRGGLISANAEAKALSPFGFAAVAGLIGLFHDQAIAKLKEVAENFLRTDPKNDRNRERLDSLDLAGSNPLPRIREIQPPSLRVNAATRTIRILGSGFVEASVVKVNDDQRQATRVSAQELSLDLSEADVRTAGTLRIVVVNPGPGGGKGTAELPVRPE
jgi:hypothetical protein